MAPRGVEPYFFTRYVAPVLLGLLLLGYVFNAAFTGSQAGAQGAYDGLSIASLLLSVAFAGLLIASLVRQEAVWRVWAILLGASVGIWIIGTVLQSFAPLAGVWAWSLLGQAQAPPPCAISASAPG